MQYISHYDSPLGNMTLASDGESLTGLWFQGQKFYGEYLEHEHIQEELPIFEETRRWLDSYFAGEKPDFPVPVKLQGTEFQEEVWQILCTIPYGQTLTYGEIAEQIAEKRGMKRMSAQAVGGAVGRNKISIIVPCHRVIGADHSLIGYAGGIDRKMALLKIEKVI